MSRRWLAALLVLAGCLPAQSGPPLNVADGGFRLHVPEAWHAEVTDRALWPRGLTVVLVSTHPIEPVCEPNANPPCVAPARGLQDGQLLVWWRSAACAGAACQPPEGAPLLVGGRAATRVEDISACAGLGATHGEAYFVTVSPQRLDGIVVCERDASEDARGAMRAMLETVEWRTP
ncbi:MAG TPA: hypothetical protein VFK61_02860 [Candidatus Limnocylindria bacterium]|nr:hypothetical protein [Candidatus Limnocylindria bacterium]